MRSSINREGDWSLGDARFVMPPTILSIVVTLAILGRNCACESRSPKSHLTLIAA
jgi:hypothetical protein